MPTRKGTGACVNGCGRSVRRLVGRSVRPFVILAVQRIGVYVTMCERVGWGGGILGVGGNEAR